MSIVERRKNEHILYRYILFDLNDLFFSKQSRYFVVLYLSFDYKNVLFNLY